MEAISKPVSSETSSELGRRVVIIGQTGSGKSTLGRKLARLIGTKYIELDALHWEPNWVEAPDEVFWQRAEQALGDPVGWVVDGNYSKVRPLVWGQAETLIWLDYPLRVNLWRLTRRTTHRIVTKELICNGNRESVVNLLIPNNNLLWWAIKTHRKKRREYPQILAQPEHAHLKVIRLQSPKATEQWLAEFMTKIADEGLKSKV